MQILNTNRQNIRGQLRPIPELRYEQLKSTYRSENQKRLSKGNMGSDIRKLQSRHTSRRQTQAARTFRFRQLDDPENSVGISLSADGLEIEDILIDTFESRVFDHLGRRPIPVVLDVGMPKLG